jgi:hypothetical protein
MPRNTCTPRATVCDLKALLVRHQVEFAQTHDIRKLLGWVAPVHPELAASLRDADILTPFGAEARYPGDAPEMLPGGETVAFDIARRTRDAEMALLGGYLKGP